MEVRKVKTTISIDQNLWTDFSVIVFKKHGGRKKNDIIEQLLRDYIRKNNDELTN